MPLRAKLTQAPQLVHWVARVPDIDAALSALATQGIDGGRTLDASRGELRWRIAVRDDGARMMHGALPALIEWRSAHPADAMPASGVSFVSLTLRSANEAALASALSALGVQGVRVQSGAPALEAVLATARGPVTIAAAR